MSLHHRIIAALRERHAANPTVIGAMIENSTDNELIRAIFANYRVGSDQGKGLAMYQGGLALMRSYFKVYAVNFDPVPEYNARQVLFLDRMVKLPWTVDKNGTFWSMDAEFAMRAKLVGDLDTLMTAFSDTI